MFKEISFSFNFNGNALNENIKSYLPDISKKPSVIDSDDDTHAHVNDDREDKTDFKNKNFVYQTSIITIITFLFDL